jgi:hypothetical protein
METLRRAWAVLNSLNPAEPERNLLDYLARLPSTGMMLVTLVENATHGRSWDELRGPWREILYALLGRAIDFPTSAPELAAQLAWLFPEQAGEIEVVLTEGL